MSIDACRVIHWAKKSPFSNKACFQVLTIELAVSNGTEQSSAKLSRKRYIYDQQYNIIYEEHLYYIIYEEHHSQMNITVTIHQFLLFQAEDYYQHIIASFTATDHCKYLDLAMVTSSSFMHFDSALRLQTYVCINGKTPELGMARGSYLPTKKLLNINVSMDSIAVFTAFLVAVS